MSTTGRVSSGKEVDLGRARQQDTKKPIGTTYHHIKHYERKRPRRSLARRRRDEIDDYCKGQE